MHIFYENKDEQFSCFKSININFPMHFHRSTELLYVTHGFIQVTIQNSTKLLHRGDIAIVFPDMVHSYQTDEESEIYLIIFNPSCTKEYSVSFQKYFPEIPFLRATTLHSDCSLCFQKIMDYAPVSENLSIAWLNLVLAYIMPEFHMLKKDRSDRPGIAYQLIHYIYDHFTEPITLDLIAEELHFNKNYISRVFSNKLNCGFQDYVNRLRLDYAMHLIKDSDKSFTDIWQEAGFLSQKTFNRVFKDRCGITPTEYRKDHLFSFTKQ